MDNATHRSAVIKAALATFLVTLLLAASAASATAVDPGGEEAAKDEAAVVCPSAPSLHRRDARCSHEQRPVCFLGRSPDRIVCLAPWHASPAPQPRTQGFPRAPRVPLWIR